MARYDHGMAENHLSEFTGEVAPPPSPVLPQDERNTNKALHERSVQYFQPDLPLDGFEGPRPPPLPVLLESDAPAAVHAGTVDYYRPERIEIDHWLEVTRCSTVAQWHQSRAALGRGQIPSIMGDGEDLTAAEREAAPVGESHCWFRNGRPIGRGSYSRRARAAGNGARAAAQCRCRSSRFRGGGCSIRSCSWACHRFLRLDLIAAIVGIAGSEKFDASRPEHFYANRIRSSAV